MASQKTILVIGATGAQGGSVARHLLKDGKFRVRALTRNPDSAKAAALKEAGAEVVRGELDDTGSLRAALDGCYGVFGVTNYWEHFEKELQHGKNLVDAVNATGVENFIFSSLPYVKKLTGGALEVPHFDLKGEITEYTQRVRPGTIIAHVAFYFENLYTFFPPKAQGDGTFALAFPQGDTPLAAVAVEDVGGVLAAVFARPGQFRGKTLIVAGDEMPPQTYTEIMSRVLGKRIVYKFIPREKFAALGFPGADDLANMFEYYRLHVPSRAKEIAECRRLYPGLQRFEAWMQANKSRFHLEATATSRASG